uniref:Glutathione S-transferase n=1 Tax=Globisporangium ultimum (strain ATCC 200006 / CBS 805.95 / DAOM BR144) TaxID=431595 RepID=K3W560_GLOUD
MSLGRLHYFNLRARGEIVRLVCAYGKLPVGEVVVPVGREFIDRKPTYPFGQLPMMEIQGKKYAQSMALARYTAKQCGLYPTDDELAALEVDMIMDTCADLITAVLHATFSERDPVQRERLVAKLRKYTLPSIMRGLDTRLRDNTDGMGLFFLGEKISVADIAVFDAVANTLLPKQDVLPVDLEREYPQVKQLMDQVQQVPTIAEYLRVRNTQETQI